jgi:hypothetical protein
VAHRDRLCLALFGGLLAWAGILMYEAVGMPEEVCLPCSRVGTGIFEFS